MFDVSDLCPGVAQKKNALLTSTANIPWTEDNDDHGIITKPSAAPRAPVMRRIARCLTLEAAEVTWEHGTRAHSASLVGFCMIPGDETGTRVELERCDGSATHPSTKNQCCFCSGSGRSACAVLGFRMRERMSGRPLTR